MIGATSVSHWPTTGTTPQQFFFKIAIFFLKNCYIFLENAKVTTKSLQTDTIINVIVFIFILFNYFYNSIVDGGFEP